MRLFERVAMKGIKFPGPLIMLSKVMFTLEGVLGDIVGPDTGMGFTLARHDRPALDRQSVVVPLAAENAGLADPAVQRIAVH